MHMFVICIQMCSVSTKNEEAMMMTLCEQKSVYFLIRQYLIIITFIIKDFYLLSSLHRRSLFDLPLFYEYVYKKRLFHCLKMVII